MEAAGSAGPKGREGGGADRRHALGWTPLMAAAANDQPAAVAELLRLGARPDLQVPPPLVPAPAEFNNIILTKETDSERAESVPITSSYLAYFAY